jgi:hypothetical protein
VNEAAEIRDVLAGAAHMRTSPANGTTDADMIQGQLQFVRDHRLPVTIEFQHASLGDQARAGLTAHARASSPQFDWIFDALQRGCAVEMGVTWAAGSGHWFTVVAAAETLGRRWLYYRDSDDGQEVIKISILGLSEPNDPFPGFLELEAEASNSIDLVVVVSPQPRFGTPCPAGAAAPYVVPQSTPAIGNAAFGLLLDNAPPSSSGAFLLGARRSQPLSLATIGFPACSLLVDATVTVPVPVDPTGAAALPVPVPNTASLVGVTFAAQAGAIGATAPHLFLTSGLEIEIAE